MPHGSTLADPVQLTRLVSLVRPILAVYHLPTADAEDVIQDALVKALEHRARIRALEPWFVTTVRNRCRRMLRVERRWSRVALERLEGTAREPRVDPRDSRWLEIDEQLRRLPRHQSAPIWLFYAEGASVEEVAAVCGNSPSSVKNQLLRARRRLARVAGNAAPARLAAG